MHTDLVTVNADADPEYAADEIAERDFPALPVVDDDGVLVGVLRTEDMIEVVEEEATEDIMKSAGFSFTDVETARSSAILESSITKILRLRLPWLIVALAGGLMAGGVIEQFEDTLEAVVALAFFVPVIMDMGGNVGTQASTIFVRGLALGHIDDRNAMRHFAREGLIGLLIGLIIGSIGAAAAYVWQINEPYALELATVVFVGLVSVCVVASVVGYVIPWIMNKLGFDPAAASDPLITTVKDITALLIYFGLAAVLLAELI
jgi:magnesium transporter